MLHIRVAVIATVTTLLMGAGEKFQDSNWHKKSEYLVDYRTGDALPALGNSYSPLSDDEIVAGRRQAGPIPQSKVTIKDRIEEAVKRTQSELYEVVNERQQNLAKSVTYGAEASYVFAKAGYQHSESSWFSKKDSYYFLSGYYYYVEKTKSVTDIELKTAETECFKKPGTHYVSAIHYGKLLRFDIRSNKSAFATATEVQNAAKLTFGVGFFKASASYGNSERAAADKFISNSEIKASWVGGKSLIAFPAPTLAGIKAVAADVLGDPGVVVVAYTAAPLTDLGCKLATAAPRQMELRIADNLGVSDETNYRLRIKGTIDVPGSSQQAFDELEPADSSDQWPTTSFTVGPDGSLKIQAEVEYNYSLQFTRSDSSSNRMPAHFILSQTPADALLKAAMACIQNPVEVTFSLWSGANRLWEKKVAKVNPGMVSPQGTAMSSYKPPPFEACDAPPSPPANPNRKYGFTWSALVQDLP